MLECQTVSSLFVTWVEGLILRVSSKVNELEADSWAIEIAAHACYDTRLAGQYLKRLASIEPESFYSPAHPSFRVRYGRVVTTIRHSKASQKATKKCKAFQDGRVSSE